MSVYGNIRLISSINGGLASVITYTLFIIPDAYKENRATVRTYRNQPCITDVAMLFTATLHLAGYTQPPINIYHN